MANITKEEINRQYRLLKQYLTSHAILKDRYTRLSFGLDVIMIICSVIFCATAFASDDVFKWLGIIPLSAKNTLKIASISAFCASIVSLRFDWRGKAARHVDAYKKLSGALSTFRAAHISNDCWEENKNDELNSLYWNTVNNIVQIPENKFNKLKGKHLHKIEVSKHLDKYPSCPAIFISFCLTFQAIFGFLRGRRSE